MSCPLCGGNCTSIESDQKFPGSWYDCSICGQYGLTDEARLDLNGMSDDDKRKIRISLAQSLKNVRDQMIQSNRLMEMVKKVRFPKNPLEAIDKIVDYIGSQTNYSGQYVALHESNFYIVASKNKEEYEYFIEMALTLEYIERLQVKSDYDHYRLTIKGWERLDEIRRKQVTSDQAFVAMWFDKQMDEAHGKGFKPAIEETGYRPLRIDREEFSEKIDDKIIAEINRSGLVIVDFTGNRSSVYFEAGYAMGLGRKIIWTCREDDMKEPGVDFDTRQYPHIVWKDSSDLKEKLINRIRAIML